MLRGPSAPQWISKWQNIFGTFQIECEKFWTFWKFLIFHEKIMKIMKNHENHAKSWESWKSWKNRKLFEKIWKIMKNQKFSKIPKIFAFYLESSKNVLPLRNPLGSARPTQHCPGSHPSFLEFFVTLSQDLLDMLLNFKILLTCIQCHGQGHRVRSRATEGIFLHIFPPTLGIRERTLWPWPHRSIY